MLAQAEPATAAKLTAKGCKKQVEKMGYFHTKCVATFIKSSLDLQVLFSRQKYNFTQKPVQLALSVSTHIKKLSNFLLEGCKAKVKYHQFITTFGTQVSLVPRLLPIFFYLGRSLGTGLQQTSAPLQHREQLY